MLMFGLRLGDDPRAVVTTTPRPTKLIRDVAGRPEGRRDPRQRRPRTAPIWRRPFSTRSSGATREPGSGGRNSTPNSSTTCRARCGSAAIIEAARVTARRRTRAHRRRDRPGGRVGRARRRDRDHRRRRAMPSGHGYVLADASGRYAPAEWARAAIAAYRAHAADRIVAEVNNGGEMVEATLRMIDPNVPFRAVRAARGKTARAEPVAALYEQGRMHHVGAFPQLEDQMCAFATADFDRRDGRLFARPGRRAGLGAHRAAGRAARRGRNFRGLSAARREGERGSMTLFVKDANTTVQSLATAIDGNGNLVPLHAPAATNAQGVATPVGPQNPLPVINAAGAAASDGSGTVATGGSAADAVRRHRAGTTGSWCRTTRRPRCGFRMSEPPRPAAPAFRSPPMAASSRHLRLQAGRRGQPFWRDDRPGLCGAALVSAMLR